jgi:hypothetical protein
MDERFLKIEDNNNLVRDVSSNAILNTDRKAADEYRIKAQMFNDVRQQKNEINTIKQKLSDIDSIKSDMFEIKKLLKGLLKQNDIS